METAMPDTHRRPPDRVPLDRMPLDARDVVVLVPALNEALRIREVVQGALAQCPRVIVVDDGSDDDTVDRIADLPIVLLRHPRRMGKGACLRDGFREALRLGARAVLTMDGDGQHSATDIPRMLAVANRHPGCVVIGARLRRRSQKPLLRRIANEFGDWGLAWGTGYRIADSQSRQRLYPAAVAALDAVPGEDFVFESQIIISAARRMGTRCVSVPIESRYKCVHAGESFRPSHFRPLRDLWRITSHIVRQALAYGGLADVYRSIRANPAVIDDPDEAFPVGARLARDPARS